jgi:hypothetical protein
MDDQVEELGNIGLERPAFLTGPIDDGHGRQIPLGTSNEDASRRGLNSGRRATPSPSAPGVRGIGRIVRIFKSEQT